MNRPLSHRTGRNTALALLLDSRDARGNISASVWSEALRISGYSRRQLKRMLNKCLDKVVDAASFATLESKFRIDEDCITVLFITCGNRTEAYRQLAQQRPMPSFRTFARAIQQQVDAATKAYAKGGSLAVRDAQLYLPMEKVPPGHTYEFDHTELPIWVIPKGTRTPVRPHLTTAFDVGARYPLAWVVTFGRPTQEEVAACLAQAATIRLAPGGKTEVGGAPVRALWDRGLEILATLIGEACMDIGTIPVPLPAYSPNLKPHLERFHRFLKEAFIATLPGYTDKIRDVRGNSAIAMAALLEDEFLVALDKWMDWYITEHHHTSLGCTPLQAWQNGNVCSTHVPDHLLHDYFLKSKVKVKVSKNGVRFDGDYYISADLGRIIGRHADIRYLPHDRTFVEVFIDNDFVCTATNAVNLTDQQRADIVARRTEARKTARKRSTSANRQRRANHDSVERLQPGKKGTPPTVANADDSAIEIIAEELESARLESAQILDGAVNPAQMETLF